MREGLDAPRLGRYPTGAGGPDEAAVKNGAKNDYNNQKTSSCNLIAAAFERLLGRDR